MKVTGPAEPAPAGSLKMAPKRAHSSTVRIGKTPTVSVTGSSRGTPPSAKNSAQTGSDEDMLDAEEESTSASNAEDASDSGEDQESSNDSASEDLDFDASEDDDSDPDDERGGSRWDEEKLTEIMKKRYWR